MENIAIKKVKNRYPCDKTQVGKTGFNKKNKLVLKTSACSLSEGRPKTRYVRKAGEFIDLDNAKAGFNSGEKLSFPKISLPGFIETAMINNSKKTKRLIPQCCLNQNNKF